MQAVILIHGGAGTLFKGQISAEREAAAREGLQQALAAGVACLEQSALDAVEAAVKVLEDCEVFNAGRGSVYTHEGLQEMDAAIMDGRQCEAGAVAGVQGVRYPVSLARAVLQHSPHVMLSGSGAVAFARQQGLQIEPPEFFHSDYRWQQLLQIRDQDRTALDHALGQDEKKSFGTVGAVALDVHGALAAATSTGGMTNKRFGRIGDSALIGAGTYADAHCAVSATGHGEYFMRAVLAHELSARLRYTGQTLEQAAAGALQQVTELGGAGGLIVVDAKGNWRMPFNTGRMYRGVQTLTGSGEVWIY
ncbi:MAG: isoaspartyl peptidase/L-asparaginase [Candidatus Sericytochromatia bacterium]|nr:isoaspartyl peptidase/L-asparaginase [Candidatus Sericytochromatia bacterium]